MEGLGVEGIDRMGRPPVCALGLARRAATHSLPISTATSSRAGNVSLRSGVSLSASKCDTGEARKGRVEITVGSLGDADIVWGSFFGGVLVVKKAWLAWLWANVLPADALVHLRVEPYRIGAVAPRLRHSRCRSRSLATRTSSCPAMYRIRHMSRIGYN